MLVALFLLVAVGLTDERKFALRGLTKKGLLLAASYGHPLPCVQFRVYQFVDLPVRRITQCATRSGGHRNQTSVTWYPPLPQTWKCFSYTGWGPMIVSGRV